MTRSRNIVICCDGTGNNYSTNKTNVIRTCEIAVADDTQLVYYDCGIGTGGWEYDETAGTLKALNDKITGRGLRKNVADGYRFLMRTWKAGDRIFLFGFSRGAYTVRALAGMLYRCGLLRSDMDNLVAEAFRLYNEEADGLDAGFKETFCRPCPVHFIGVWDTVGSLILNAGGKFYDTSLNPEVRYGCHSIALDEQRRDFAPCLWDETKKNPGQTIDQVWFAGGHSDVGGWYAERGLSETTLRYMLSRARAQGMKLHEDKFNGIRSNPLDKMHDSYKGFWHFRGSHKRQVPAGAKIHHSVSERMKKTNYKPVRPLPDDVTFVND